MSMHPLLAGLEGLDGPALKARFAEARSAAVAAGAQVEADAATRALQMAMRNAIRAMVKGIDAVSFGAPEAAKAPAPAPPAPRPAPMRPVIKPPAAAPASSKLGGLKRPPVEAAEAPEQAATARPGWRPPPPPVPQIVLSRPVPPHDPEDDAIPW